MVGLRNSHRWHIERSSIIDAARMLNLISIRIEPYGALGVARAERTNWALLSGVEGQQL